jgi:hypothetical protein
MGEIRTWVDRTEYISVLKKEIEVLKTKHKPHEEGTGHFNTAISVLEGRIKEIEEELSWPFPKSID